MYEIACLCRLVAGREAFRRSAGEGLAEHRLNE